MEFAAREATTIRVPDARVKGPAGVATQLSFDCSLAPYTADGLSLDADLHGKKESAAWFGAYFDRCLSVLRSVLPVVENLGYLTTMMAASPLGYIYVGAWVQECARLLRNDTLLHSSAIVAESHFYGPASNTFCAWHLSQMILKCGRHNDYALTCRYDFSHEYISGAVNNKVHAFASPPDCLAVKDRPLFNPSPFRLKAPICGAEIWVGSFHAPCILRDAPE